MKWLFGHKKLSGVDSQKQHSLTLDLRLDRTERAMDDIEERLNKAADALRENHKPRTHQS